MVIPCFNEEAVLELTHARLLSALAYIDLDLEIIYVDDGSADRTHDILRCLAEAAGRVRVVRFSRNFGRTQ